jgi:hypothetical protein
VHELIIVAGYAFQPWSPPVVYSPRLGAGRVWGDARRRKAIIVSDIGVIWAALWILFGLRTQEPPERA